MLGGSCRRSRGPLQRSKCHHSSLWDIFGTDLLPALPPSLLLPSCGQRCSFGKQSRRVSLLLTPSPSRLFPSGSTSLGENPSPGSILDSASLPTRSSPRCFCCPVCGLCQERGTFSLAGKERSEMDTEVKNTPRVCRAWLALFVSCLLLAMRGWEGKKKDFLPK